MKTIAIEKLPSKLKAMVDSAQRERVIVTRKDKPIAVLVGIENKDEEDLALERDADFWKMIRERRREKSIPLDEVKKRLGLLNGIDQKAVDTKPHYSILIQWSDKDQTYLAFLPEFSKEPQTRGSTYQEAMKNAQEALELRTDALEENGRDLPRPRTYQPRVSGRKAIKKSVSHGKSA